MDKLPDDIIAFVFQNNIGLSTFAKVQAVCKSFRRVCHSAEGVLVAAALYTGGLTRTDFMGLFTLSAAECTLFPHVWVDHYWIGGQYRLYRENAVEQAVRALGGIEGWSSRVSTRGRLFGAASDRAAMSPRARSTRRRKWVLEEDWHRQLVPARPLLPVGYAVSRAGPTPPIRKNSMCMHKQLRQTAVPGSWGHGLPLITVAS